MAAMSTVLTPFSTNGDARTSVLAAHSAQKPQLVVEKRKVPQGKEQVAENTITVSVATTDASGAVISSRYSYTIIARSPVDGQSADKAVCLAALRDIVTSDNFATTLATQRYL